MSFTMLFDPRPVIAVKAGYVASDALFVGGSLPFFLAEPRLWTRLWRKWAVRRQTWSSGAQDDGGSSALEV